MKTGRTALLALVAALVAAFVSSCSIGSSTTTRGRTEGFEDEVTVGTSLSVHGNKPDAWLEQARQRARDGLWADAAALFHRVHGASDATDEQKATALLELARLNLNVLNPGRSEAMAREYFERVAAEFPETESARKAKERLELLGPTE